MKRASLLVAAGTSSAFGYNTLQGSDTLENLTKNMIALCAPDSVALGFDGIAAANPAPGGLFELEYIGGGSTTGEQAMRGVLSGGVSQVIAPMSRALRDSPNTPDVCQDDVTLGEHQWVIARDAVIFATATSNLVG